MNTSENPPSPSCMKPPRLTFQLAAKLLEDYEASGLSLAAFARSRGYAENALYNWRDKVRRRDEGKSPSPAAALVNVTQALESACVPAVIFSGGIRLENPQLLSDADLQRMVRLASC